jgi:hypothetical protein
MKLRQIKRRRDKMSTRFLRSAAGYGACFGWWDEPWDDLCGDPLRDPFDDGGETSCPCCGGLGGDPMCDYVLPCPECGEG